MALRSLKSLLPRALMRHGVEGGVTAAQVIAVMEEEIARKWGEEGRRGIRVKYFKQGAIAVACQSSVWAQEVKLKEQELLTAVRQKIGAKTPIERIRIVV